MRDNRFRHGMTMLSMQYGKAPGTSGTRIEMPASLQTTELSSILEGTDTDWLLQSSTSTGSCSSDLSALMESTTVYMQR